MKLLITAIAFLLSVVTLLGQDDQVAAMNVSFEKYGSAVLSKEYKTAVSLLHPDIIEKGGGEFYMIQDIKRDVSQYEAIGVSIIAMNSKQPSVIVEAGEELHAMLPVEIIMKTPNDTVSETNFFLAASQDDGKSWFFVDMRKQDEESIKVFLPHYNSRLNFFLKQ